MFNTGKYQEELKKAFESKIVDFEIPVIWYEAALKALEFASPIGIGVRSEQMLQLYNVLDKRVQLNYMEFAILATNLESRTCRDLDMKFQPYIELMVMAGELTAKWKESSAKIEAKVLKKVQISSN